MLRTESLQSTSVGESNATQCQAGWISEPEALTPIADSVAKLNSNRVTTASACGKSILCGEHAVVYGTLAVALPIPNMRMQIKVQESTPRPNTNRHSLKLDMRLSGRPVSDHVHSVALQALELLSVELPTNCLSIEGDSNLWIGAGLGSSASLCVGLLRGFSKHWHIDLSPEDLALKANILEARFHGKPSGLDVSVVALEQLISFRKGHHPTALPTQSKTPGFHFVILDSQVRASTKSMVERAAPYFSGTKGEQRLYKFDQLSHSVISSLADGDFKSLAENLQTAGAWLEEAGVVARANKELQEIALGAGALAAKITGAGGGGAVLALLSPDVPKSTQVERLVNALGRHRVLEMTL